MTGWLVEILRDRAEWLAPDADWAAIDATTPGTRVIRDCALKTSFLEAGAR
jgi:hypothetical protein